MRGEKEARFGRCRAGSPCGCHIAGSAMATGARPSTPTTRPLHTERAQPRQFVGVPSGGTLRVAHGVVRIESGAKACLLSWSTVCGTTERKRLHQKARTLRPVTLTPLTSLASLCAPKETTPPLAHRSTSSRACMIEIERRRTSAARALGALALSRSPNPHPPTHHLTFACARPLSRQVFSSSLLARPPHPRASQHGAAQRKRCRCGCARAHLALDGLASFFLAPASASSSRVHEQQAPGCSAIAIINGRTYIRYALGLCTGLSR